MLRDSPVVTAYQHLREIERFWPVLVINATPGRPGQRSAPARSADELDELVARKERRDRADQAARQEAARLGYVPLGESPAPANLAALDVMATACGEILDLEAEVRRELALRPWSAPDRCPRCGFVLAWNPDQQRLYCSRSDLSSWPLLLVCDRDDPGFWSPCPFVTLHDLEKSGGHTLGRDLDAYRRPVQSAGLERRPLDAAVWLRTQLSILDRGHPDLLDRVVAATSSTARAIRLAVGDVPEIVQLTVPCPYCECLSLSVNLSAKNPVVTCSSNAGPDRAVVCRCAAECETCTRGGKHTWARTDWARMGWTKGKDLDPDLLKLFSPQTKERQRKRTRRNAS